MLQVGPPTTGYLKFNVTCTHLGEVMEDGMTDMSGLTSEADQDLDGAWKIYVYIERVRE